MKEILSINDFVYFLSDEDDAVRFIYTGVVVGIGIRDYEGDECLIYHIKCDEYGVNIVRKQEELYDEFAEAFTALNKFYKKEE